MLNWLIWRIASAYWRRQWNNGSIKFSAHNYADSMRSARR
jgi:hypothetical protein